MSKQLTPLQQRYADRAAQSARLAEALAKHRANRPALRHAKRPCSDELRRYLHPKIGQGSAIRDAREFRSSTYNLGRRLIEFVDHMFVRYPVPFFLYRSVLTDNGWRQLVQSEERLAPCSAWEREAFFAAAQGRSVADVMKGRLTRKETHWFLNAPNDQTSRQNVVWAKLVTAGARPVDANFLVSRVCPGNLLQLVGDRLAELGHFFGQYGAEMDVMTRTTIMDYLAAAFRDASFTLKGRTLGSVIELSRRWHATDIAGTMRVPYKAWKSAFSLWEATHKGELVRGVELTNTRALAEEGRHQRHCVYMYADACESGGTSIVSLRWLASDELGDVKIVKRLTVEVSRSREVCQVRGACNRMPNDDEVKVLRLWMGSHGLTLRHL